MKYLKIVFVFVLFVFIGSCSLFFPTTTYYYYVHANCSYNGYVGWSMPTGAYTNFNSPWVLTSAAYKFKAGTRIAISAGWYNWETVEHCYGQYITVSILKGESAEGSPGSGGTVVASNTQAYVVYVDYTVK
jgi:hypothetical protein